MKMDIRTCGINFRINYKVDGILNSMQLKDGYLLSTISGMQFRNGVNRNNLSVEKKLILKREENNPVDPCAIAIYDGNTHIGYIPHKHIPVVMTCISDEGVEAVIDKIDDAFIGIMIEPTFHFLGKRPELGLSKLEFMVDNFNDSNKFYPGDILSEAEFLNNFEYQHQCSYNEQPSKLFSLGKEYISEVYLYFGEMTVPARAMLYSAQTSKKDTTFKFTIENDEVLMFSDVLGMRSTIPSDIDDEELKCAVRAVRNKQKVEMTPILSDLSEEGITFQLHIFPNKIGMPIRKNKEEEDWNPQKNVSKRPQPRSIILKDMETYIPGEDDDAEEYCEYIENHIGEEFYANRKGLGISVLLPVADSDFFISSPTIVEGENVDILDWVFAYQKFKVTFLSVDYSRDLGICNYQFRLERL